MAVFRFSTSTEGGSARGPRAGFDEIYGAHAPAILRYLKRVTGSREAAEELAQEAFLRLHVQLSGGEPLQNERAWLFRVATNLANDHARAGLRSGRRDEQYAAGRAAVVEFDRRFERQQAILDALRALPPRMRQVLLLFAEGCTYREIAEITGVETGYVGVLLQRGRAAFGRQYESGAGADGRTARRVLR